MKYLYAATLLSFLFFKVGYGQTSPADLQKVFPPSPTAASLGKYAEWPVSLFTGVPGISIPLYELKGRTVSVPISLNYHASGIRIGEIASPVGLGWSLSAGGVITRSVRGVADDNPYGGYLLFRQNFSNPQDLSDVDSSMNDLLNAAAKGSWDTQPDEWMFSAMGRSFSFFFNGSGKIVTQPYSNVKITADFSHYTFTVVLEDGTTLIFGGTGCTETTTGSLNNIIQGANSYISSWYLSKIISSDGETVTFSYNPQTIVHNSNFSETDYLPYVYDMGGIIYNVNLGCPCGTTGWPVTDLLNFEYQTVEGLSLASIESDLGKVYFDKDVNARQDNPGDTAITGMRALSKLTNKVVKEYHLAYNYSSASGGNKASTGSHPEEGVRLKLQSVGEFMPGTGVQINQWRMDYNPTSLPNRSSFAQDHWGYYNGAANNQTLLPTEAHFLSSDGHLSGNRATNPAYTQAEMLTKITYPTGGSSSFTFEPNSYPDTAELFSDTAAGVKFELDTGSVTQKQVSFTLANSQNITFVISALYDQAYLNVHNGCSGLPWANLFDGNNHLVTSLQVCGTGSQNQHLTLDSGTYTIVLNRDLYRPASDSNENFVFASLYYEHSLGIQPYTHYTGGVRLHSLVYSDSINTANNNTQVFQYEQPYVVNPVDSVNDYITDYSAECFSNLNFCTTYTLIRSSASKFTLGSIQGGVIGYGKVTTLFGANGGNGKTVAYFSTQHNNANPFNHLYPYTPATSRDWDRGLTVATYTYDSTARLVSSERNIIGPISKDYITAIKMGSNPAYSGVTQTGMLTPGLIYHGYDIVTDMVEHTQAIETKYSSSGTDSVSVIKNFFYDNPNFVQPTRTQEFNSKGDTLTTVTAYALDSIGDLSAGALQAQDSMVARNMVGMPLEQTSLYNSKPVSKVQYNYKVWPNNLVLPESVALQESVSPIETRVQYTSYTSAGNLVTQHKYQDVLNSYVWDYQHIYPVAEVKNADSASIAYTSFETSSTGGWTVGTVSRQHGGVTGDSSYSLSSDISRGGLNASTTYIVSYWTKNSAAFSISGTIASYPVKGRIDHGWTLYTHKVTGQSSISISGTGSIDELRLYPANAQMTTYTYTPLIGISSSCDVGDKITAYEYDGVGRLLRIRDMDSNILKQYDYQYQAHVISPYYNTMQTLAFTRNNCACGYSGSSVTDTAAAGTFSSYVSQADANQQAMTALTNNGQGNANTKGTCTVITCTGNNHKMISCVCQTGTLVIMSQTYSGGKCTTQYGYQFSDGSVVYDHTTVLNGNCPF